MRFSSVFSTLMPAKRFPMVPVLSSAARMPFPGAESAFCPHAPMLSHTMYQSNGSRKSTPPENRQLIVLMSDGTLKLTIFVGGSTFQNLLIDTFCEMKWSHRRMTQEGGKSGEGSHQPSEVKCFSSVGKPPCIPGGVGRRDDATPGEIHNEKGSLCGWWSLSGSSAAQVGILAPSLRTRTLKGTRAGSGIGGWGRSTSASQLIRWPGSLR